MQASGSPRGPEADRPLQGGPVPEQVPEAASPPGSTVSTRKIAAAVSGLSTGCGSGERLRPCHTDG